MGNEPTILIVPGLPMPHLPLPFPGIVAASRNDPIATFDRVVDLAAVWGSRVVDLGEVGHLNPASGYGEWPRALALIEQRAARAMSASGSMVQ